MGTFEFARIGGPIEPGPARFLGVPSAGGMGLIDSQSGAGRGASGGVLVGFVADGHLDAVLGVVWDWGET